MLEFSPKNTQRHLPRKRLLIVRGAKWAGDMRKRARSPGSSREGCVGACFASTLCLHRPLFFPTLFFGLSLFLHRPFPCIDPLLLRPLFRFDPPLSQPLFASTFFCFDSLLYRPLFLCIAPFLCRKYRKWRPVEPGYYE